MFELLAYIAYFDYLTYNTTHMEFLYKSYSCHPIDIHVLFLDDRICGVYISELVCPSSLVHVVLSLSQGDQSQASRNDT